MGELLAVCWRLMRADKPIGTILLLWPTLWGLWWSFRGVPPFRYLIVFVLGVWVTRSAGCVINDIADRKIDPHVSRTRLRPLAAGALSVRVALLLFVSLLLCALMLLLFLPSRVWPYGVFAAALMVLYPFTKRVSYFPQCILAAAFSMGAVMAFVISPYPVPWLQVLLCYTTSWLWTVMYDTEYAMTDRPDDLRLGVKSLAVFLGVYDRAVIAILQCLCLISWCAAGYLARFSWCFYVTAAVAAAGFAYQQHLIARREPQQCFAAFLNNAWIGGFLFLGLVLEWSILPAL